LAFAPSKKCSRCLLTKLGLTQFTARLFRGIGDDRCPAAFHTFDALPLHTVTVA
jgi:hypothetical protein